MDNNILITFAVCVISIFIFIVLNILFKESMVAYEFTEKYIISIIKLIGNSIVGGIIIFLINLIGANFGFHIGLNIGTALVVGILGIPGAILLIILTLFLL